MKPNSSIPTQTIMQRSKPAIIIKTVVAIFIMMCAAWGANAQGAPQKFNYSSQLTDSLGFPIHDTFIRVKATLHSGSASGPIEYSEMDSAVTNKQGIFTVVIGGGIILAGNFSQVPWSSDAVYFEVGIDVNGGTNYVSMGAAQLISYPYSLVAGNGIGPLGFDSTGKFGIVSADGLTIKTSSKNAWLTTGNFVGTSTAYAGTNDTFDFVLKRGGVEAMRLSSNKAVSTSGNLGVGVNPPLTAADVNGALALRDTVINVSANFTINVGNHSTFLINSSVTASHAVCTLTNGTVAGQLLILMVSGTSGNGIGISAGSNLRLPVGESIKDGGTLTLIWNGTQWLQTSITNNQ